MAGVDGDVHTNLPSSSLEAAGHAGACSNPHSGGVAVTTGVCVVVEIVQIYAGAAVASVSSSSAYTLAGSVEAMADVICGSPPGSRAGVLLLAKDWGPGDMALGGLRGPCPVPDPGVARRSGACAIPAQCRTAEKRGARGLASL